MITALIDADMVVYQCAHAASRRYYTVEGWRKNFKYIKAAREWCDKKAQKYEDIKLNVVPKDTIENVLDTVDGMLHMIIKDSGCLTGKLYLTGANNYRKEIATTHKYKGNRTVEAKPPFLAEIREHMISMHGAEVNDLGEADDSLGINQDKTGQWTVLCSRDKDLLMIPGSHYNWGSAETKQVTVEEGEAFFWKQMLTGDATDNIHAIKGIGPKKADKLLEGVAVQDMKCVVGLQYAIHFDDPEVRMIENGILLWIQQEEGQVWNLDIGIT